METIKIIKTQEKKLSDLKLNIVDLEFKDIENSELYFLKDNLSELIKELLEKNKIKADLGDVYYSLSNCQGDGIMFEGEFEYKGCVFKVKQAGHYCHENSKNIHIDTYKGKYDYELTEKQNKKIEQLEKEFDEIYVSICKEAERQGYSWIEEEEKESILRAGFRRFLENNNLNEDLELWDFEYADEEKKGFIKICDSGDSYIKGLWIENFKVRVEDKIKASCDIVEYQDLEVLK